jgi:transcription antitermination factor NusG
MNLNDTVTSNDICEPKQDPIFIVANKSKGTRQAAYCAQEVLNKSRIDAKWYALYTAPRAEKKVEERLSAIGVSCYLPEIKEMKKWSDRVKTVETPLFRSYIFVNCKSSELLALNKIYGVVRVVYYNGKPALIRDYEIEQIREFLGKADNCELVSGDKVDIVCGALASSKRMSGKIIRTKGKYLILILDQLGIKACVKRTDVIKSAHAKAVEGANAN